MKQIKNYKEKKNVMDSHVDELIQNARNVNTLDAFCVWNVRCEECITILREKCCIRGSTGSVNAAVAQLTRLQEIATRLRRRFIHEGGGDGAGPSVEPDEELSWFEIETAFRNRVLTGVVVNLYYIEPQRFLESARDVILQQVEIYLQRHNGLKVNTIFYGEFVTDAKSDVKTIATKNSELFGASNLLEWYNECVMNATLTALEDFQERDSGWALSRILNLTVNINKFNPLHAGCWITLAREIASKKATVNVRVYDNACFAWSIVAALYPVNYKSALRSNYPNYSDVLCFDGISFPVTLNDIPRFENLNDISINVFTPCERRSVNKHGARTDTFAPLLLTTRKRDFHVNLLYVHKTANRGHPNVGHFVWVKSLSRLLGPQCNLGHATKFICDRCLHYFPSMRRLKSHEIDCIKANDCAVRLPNDETKWLSFENFYRIERHPYVVYADLECILEKQVDAREGSNTGEAQVDAREGSNTGEAASFAVQHHKVFNVGYYVCNTIDANESKYRTYRGDNCMSWFADELYKLANNVKYLMTKDLTTTRLTNAERVRLNEARVCNICGLMFESLSARKIDRCRVTGVYKGAAHSKCLLKYNELYVIPVFFHNLSGYDAHFIINDIANRFPGKVELLPLTKEAYISFTKSVDNSGAYRKSRIIKLRFLDSYKFLSTSLDKLTSYLDKDKFRIMRKEFNDLDETDLELLTRKGVFPYEYVNNIDKLRDTCLPSREKFYSSLTDEAISVEDYAHANEVWERFRIESLGDYSDLYLKTDVLLLADIFENFRDTCMSTYALDPACYYTLPGYTWDAMLKYTNIKFELLTDIDMVLFVERGVRGGVSQCVTRYSSANNKYTPENYDPSIPSTYLMYFDVNNLYGWAMCEPLPFGSFQWVHQIENFDVMSIPKDSSTGYLLEVDIAYPQSLHDNHMELPFCPTRERPPGKRNEKLLTTLYDKSRYVIHYRNLQQCILHGLEVTKIHRVLQFAQSTWLRDYIELNTQLRILARNEFERNLYKLMNNAIYGKTMENVRDRVDVRLVTRWDGRYGAESYISKPNFHSRSIFSEELMAVQLRKMEVVMNKPIYVGMSILEISKIKMYEFHYDYMKSLYGRNCLLLYTDTDSLIYQVECEDVYEDMKCNIAHFDTSGYLESNPYNMPQLNAKIPGLMKDENNGAIMMEFIGLRAKMYALKVMGKNDTKRIKGVKKSVVAKTITFEDYMSCLTDQYEQSRRQTCIRSRLHEVYTMSESKLALSPYDDKRYVADNSVITFPWGHYSIPL